MRDPSMIRTAKTFSPRSSLANMGVVTAQLNAGAAKRVSFSRDVQVDDAGRLLGSAPAQSLAPAAVVEPSFTTPNAASSPSTLKERALREQIALQRMFASAAQRDRDMCLQFALHGGPLVKYSSRARRPPALCSFRLTPDCARLVWAEASKPGDERYGFDTSTLLQVLVGTAAAAEFESLDSNVKQHSLKLVLLLQGDEKLRLEALDKANACARRAPADH
jgi:hypothetical protein